MVALAKIPLSILEEQKSKLIIVGCSPAQRIESFAKDTGANIDILYTDPTLSIHKKIGLIRASGLSQLKGKGEKSQETKSGFFGGLMWSLKKSMFNKSGDVYQVKI